MRRLLFLAAVNRLKSIHLRKGCTVAATESNHAIPSQSSWEEQNSKMVGMGKVRLRQSL